MFVAQSYTFEGKTMTISEIQATVPGLSKSMVRTYVKKGMTTRQQLLSYDSRSARLAGARKGRKMWEEICHKGYGSRNHADVTISQPMMSALALGD